MLNQPFNDKKHDRTIINEVLNQKKNNEICLSLS